MDTINHHHRKRIDVVISMICRPITAAATAAASSIAFQHSLAVATLTPKPTAKPSFQVWAGIGCPEEWVDGSAYEAKDVVVVDGVVYECSSQE